MSNSLDPDQARHFVWPDLGPNCLQKYQQMTMVGRVNYTRLYKNMFSALSSEDRFEVLKRIITKSFHHKMSLFF